MRLSLLPWEKGNPYAPRTLKITPETARFPAFSKCCYSSLSMNNKVTATNMQITATSNLPYLVINEELAETNTTYGTVADAMTTYGKTGTGANLKLVTPLNVASNVAYYATAGAASTTTPTKFTGSSNVLWGTTTSSNPAEVQASNVTTLVGSDVLTEYVLKNELYFKILPGNINGTHLTCTGVRFTDGTNSIAASGRVLIVSESGKYQLFKLVETADDASTTEVDESLKAAESGSDSWLIETITTTASDSQKLSIYFFFDGTDSSAYTNNATDLSQVTAEFAFAID